MTIRLFACKAYFNQGYSNILCGVVFRGERQSRVHEIKGLDKQKKNQRKVVIIFLHNNFNICFVCPKEPSH